MLRYWVTILAACSIGETVADLVSHELGLGYVRASAGFLTLFAVLAALERRLRVRPATRYWTAIVLMSTTGTTLADLFTRTLGLGYTGTSLALGALFVAVLTVHARRATPTGAHPSLLPHAHVRLEHTDLPDTDGAYWAAIMVASTLGTSLGDFVSDVLDAGFGTGTALLGSVLAVLLVAEHRAVRGSRARYWASLVTASTIGATSGDWLTKDDGLGLSFPVVIVAQVATFVVLAVLGSRAGHGEVGAADVSGGRPTAAGAPRAPR